MESERSIRVEGGGKVQDFFREKQIDEAIAIVKKSRSFLLLAIVEEGEEGKSSGYSIMSCTCLEDAMMMHKGYMESQRQYVRELVKGKM